MELEKIKIVKPKRITPGNSEYFNSVLNRRFLKTRGHDLLQKKSGKTRLNIKMYNNKLLNKIKAMAEEGRNTRIITIITDNRTG
jgi:hypothetical protein